MRRGYQVGERFPSLTSDHLFPVAHCRAAPRCPLPAQQADVQSAGMGQDGTPHSPTGQQVGLLNAQYLENSDDGPEQGVEVLPVGQGVAIPLGSKLAAKEVHPQNAARRAQC